MRVVKRVPTYARGSSSGKAVLPYVKRKDMAVMARWRGIDIPTPARYARCLHILRREDDMSILNRMRACCAPRPYRAMRAGSATRRALSCAFVLQMSRGQFPPAVQSVLHTLYGTR